MVSFSIIHLQGPRSKVHGITLHIDCESLKNLIQRNLAANSLQVPSPLKNRCDRHFEKNYSCSHIRVTEIDKSYQSLIMPLVFFRMIFQMFAAKFLVVVKKVQFIVQIAFLQFLNPIFSKSQVSYRALAVQLHQVPIYQRNRKKILKRKAFRYKLLGKTLITDWVDWAD